MLRHFTRKEASQILDISLGRLRYWDRVALVRPSFREKGRVYYDFKDLICLRTAQGLAEKGLSARKIKSSIKSLKAKFPVLDGQLSSKRIYVLDDRVIVSHRNRLIDTHSGQLLLKFDVDELNSKAERSLEKPEIKSAQEWFSEGQRLQRRAETRNRALEAYQEAVKIDPSFADAYVSMGTIFYLQRKFIDAQRCYRQALRRNPHHARAAFNLGNVLDELKCTEDSVRWYERAVEVEPEFADAYFNLAAATEKLGLWDRAIRYWRAYLQFDDKSRHARTARQRIKLIERHLASS